MWRAPCTNMLLWVLVVICSFEIIRPNVPPRVLRNILKPLLCTTMYTKSTSARKKKRGGQHLTCPQYVPPCRADGSPSGTSLASNAASAGEGIDGCRCCSALAVSFAGGSALPAEAPAPTTSTEEVPVPRVGGGTPLKPAVGVRPTSGADWCFENPLRPAAFWVR